jgi:hypothetical protein
MANANSNESKSGKIFANLMNPWKKAKLTLYAFIEKASYYFFAGKLYIMGHFKGNFEGDKKFVGPLKYYEKWPIV